MATVLPLSYDVHNALARVLVAHQPAAERTDALPGEDGLLDDRVHAPVGVDLANRVKRRSLETTRKKSALLELVYENRGVDNLLRNHHVTGFLCPGGNGQGR
jgi:hypothetical protein